MSDPTAPGPEGPFSVARVDDLERIEVAGVVWRPLRRRLGIGPFGANVFTADGAGDELIEEHDETGAGAGAHEELYVVLAGRATFAVAGETVDAPAGTFVHVRELDARRGAVAAEPGTAVLVVGAPPANALPTSAFEYWFAAEPAYDAGDYDEAIRIVTAGLEAYPEHPSMLYQLACYHALAGRRAEALDHLRRAVAAAPDVREWAAGDADLDSIRDDPAYPA